MPKKKVKILDVTVRDGSYLMSFKYTAEQVGEIVKKLQSCGVEYAEIGHGISFGAKKAGLPAASTDEEQIEAAYKVRRGAKHKIKLGVIGLLPVFNPDDLKPLAKKLHFVRLACNVIVPEYLEDIVPKCKDMGLKVFVQMMRSSAVTAKEAATSAAKLSKYGADVIYIVDTAGAFVPDEVPEFVKRVKDASKKEVGFHAHNNLMLATANSMAAVEAGVDFVDASLRGVGRGSGNVALEILVLLLKKYKYECKINAKKLFMAAENLENKLWKYVPRVPVSDPYIAAKKRDFFPFQLLEKIAKEMKVNVYTLIDDLTKFKAGTELTIDDIGDIIVSHGQDENEIFKKIGLIPSV